jgi:hypothetical protein
MRSRREMGDFLSEGVEITKVFCSFAQQLREGAIPIPYLGHAK